MAQLLKAIVDTQKNNYKAIGQVNTYDGLELELEMKMNGVNVELVNPSFELISKKADGNRVRQLKDISYADRKIKIIADEQITACSKSGIVSNQLIVKDEGRMSTCLFYFLLGSSLDREIIQSIDKVEVLEQLDEYVATAFANLDEFEKRIITGEATIRKLNDDMTSAESSREESETNRGSTFDDLVLRMDNAIRAAISTDETLKNNEVDRINNYNILKRALEIIREELISLNNSVALEEQKRVQAEIDRTNANIEAINKLNSTNASIEKAEALRGKEWETIKSENTSLKEALTTINNTANSNEEVRKTNESERVTAEQNRVTEFNKIKEDNKVLETNLVKKVDDKIGEIEAQNNQFKDETTADYNAFTEGVDRQILKSKTDYFGKEHISVDERLNEDFDNIHQRVNNSEYLSYEGSNITANNSYYGLTKDMVVKGRTLQNLVHKGAFYNRLKWNNTLPQTALSENNGYVTLNANGSYINAFQNLNGLFRPSKKYTIILEVKENTLEKNNGYGFILMNNHTEEIFIDVHSMTTLNLAKGIYKVVVTTKDDISNCKYTIRSYISSATITGKIVFRYAIFEGDYTQTPLSELPYIEGIQSVGDLVTDIESPYYGKYKVEVKSCGKNLYNIANTESVTLKGVTLTNNSEDNSIIVNGITTETFPVSIGINVTDNLKVGKTYSVSGTVGEAKVICRRKFKDGTLKYDTPFVMSDEVVAVMIYMQIEKTGVSFDNVKIFPQVEENPSPTTYEPYISDAKIYYLDEPLRSLSNGVDDENKGNKLIRRVGKIVIDGTNYKLADYGKSDTVIRGAIVKSDMKHFSKLICDKMPANVSGMSETPWSKLGVACYHENVIYFHMDKTLYPTIDDVNNFIKSNPTTIYYELAEPIIIPLDGELTLKTFDTTTHITSNNYLLPKLSAKVPSNVQAVVSGLRTENEVLKTDLKIMNLVTEENNIKNIETNLDQEARLTMIEMGVI